MPTSYNWIQWKIHHCSTVVLQILSSRSNSSIHIQTSWPLHWATLNINVVVRSSFRILSIVINSREPPSSPLGFTNETADIYLTFPSRGISYYVNGCYVVQIFILLNLLDDHLAKNDINWVDALTFYTLTFTAMVIISLSCELKLLTVLNRLMLLSWRELLAKNKRYQSSDRNIHGTWMKRSSRKTYYRIDDLTLIKMTE